MLLCWMFVILSCYCSHTPPGNIVMGSPCRASHQRWCISFCRESQGFPTHAQGQGHGCDVKWLNPGYGLLKSNCREFLSWVDIFDCKHLSEATLREKVCWKSFPFSPFVNCANACVQLWHSREVDLFKQSQESTIQHWNQNHLHNLGQGLGHRRIHPTTPWHAVIVGAGKSFGCTKHRRRYVESW